jgi:hypothetical protein
MNAFFEGHLQAADEVQDSGGLRGKGRLHV